MTKSYLRKAFKRWQNNPFGHPFTCMSTYGKGNHNLVFDKVDKDGRVHLRCPNCSEYHQKLTPELQNLMVKMYKENYLEKRKLTLEIYPFGFRVYWKVKSPFDLQ